MSKRPKETDDMAPTIADLSQIEEIAPITDDEFAALVAEARDEGRDMEDWYAELPGYEADFDVTGEESRGL